MNQQISHKCRIYPTRMQQTTLAQEFGCSRYIYNHFLFEAKTSKWNYLAASKQITQMRCEMDWLNAACRSGLTTALIDLNNAFLRFFKHQNKYPKFKHKDKKQSIRYQGIDICDNAIKLPKLGWIKVKITKQICSKPKQITISKYAQQYYASFSYETNIEHLPVVNKIVGIDVGLTDLITTSDGIKIQNPKWFNQKQIRLGRYQRKMARRVKGGNNRNKTKFCVQRIYRNITNTKQDFLHKLTKKIIDENQVIAVEKLQISSMLQNKHLSKSIWQSGWNELFRQLRYKANYYGRVFVEVDPAYTSKMCSVCGNVTDLTLNDRSWKCDCGVQHDRDINAAKNILNKGLGLIRQGLPKFMLEEIWSALAEQPRNYLRSQTRSLCEVGCETK